MNIRKILKEYWGFDSFRPMQEEIINSVLSGKDTLALLPTGGGKSICYQVPALAQNGLCVVISPLIALMKDQVENLKQRNIPANAIISGMGKRAVDIALDNCIYGKTKLLYLSPERLFSELIQIRMQKMNINLIAVDEAHCISQWGYDFRPSYLQIAEIRSFVKNIPVLALTATATPEVKEDIQQKLLFKEPNLFQGSFRRENLAYIVIHEENKLNKLIKVAQNVSGSGIVYVRNRKTTKEVAAYLKKKGISADFYHAGLDITMRSQKQEEWKTNKTRIIVCTNAFGMGIDKPDVRFVVHLNLPESLEAYYQEAGRSGRDNNKAYAVLLYMKADNLDFEQRYQTIFPTLESIKKMYHLLANYFNLAIGSGELESFDFDIADFCSSFNLDTINVYNCLKVLEKQGFLLVNEEINASSKLMFNVNNNELYRFQIANPKLDGFIKLLLRSFEGLFNDFARISEKDIAKKTQKTPDEVVRLLEFLDKNGIVIYEKQKNDPQIMFTEPRRDAKKLYIDKENLETRKQVYYKKMLAVLNYAESKDLCRSRMLLSYFGEHDSNLCGLCDICISRNKLNLKESEFEAIFQQIKILLNAEKIPLIELVQLVKGANEDKTLKTIQWLVDNKTLRIFPNNVVGLDN